MSFITPLIDEVIHLGDAANVAEESIKNAKPGSEAKLNLLIQASFYYAHVQLQRGVSLADEAIALSEKLNDTKGMARALCVKAMNQLRIGYLNEAYANASEALSLFEVLHDTGGSSDAHWLLSTMMELLPEVNQVKHHLEQAMSGYMQLGNRTGIYLVRIQQTILPLLSLQFDEALQEHKILLDELNPSQHYLRCYCYKERMRLLFVQHDIPGLISSMEEWKELASASGDFHDYTQSKSLLTECYRIQKLDKNVMQACIESMKCCEQLGCLTGISAMYIILANICNDQSQYTDAISYYHKADELAVTLSAIYKHFYALSEIGKIHLKMGEFGKAKETFEKVLKEATAANHEVNIITAHRYLAELALEQGRHNDAFRAFKNLFDTAKSFTPRIEDYGKYIRTLALASDETLQECGISSIDRNQHRLSYLDRYLALAQDGKNQHEEANAYKEFAAYYEGVEDFKKALDYYDQYRICYEELTNEQSMNAIAGLRMQYESEVKDREIALLKKEKSEMLLQERLRISRDLHDDMGATLSSISILATVAKQQLGQHRIIEVERLMDQISSEASEMVNNVSDLVWMINPKNDNLEKLMDRIYSYANQVLSSNQIIIRLRIDEELRELVPSMEARKNIYLLLKEAINNTAKYSDCSEVSISSRKENGSISCTVSDNGKGFDGNHSKAGNGLHNMKQRAGELKGLLTILSKNGHGTEVNLTLPLGSLNCF